jgi:triosephosphate isomerase
MILKRKNLIGNWKMNTTFLEAIELVKNLSQNLQINKNAAIGLCPPFPYLSALKSQLNENILLGAQDCSSQKSGAFTGEVAADMLASVGVNLVIIGHSERRKYHNESNEILLLKTKQAIDSKLTPVFCIGENLEIREKSLHIQEVLLQLQHTVFLLNKEDFSKLIIAYEPVWAIGTGLNASPEQAQEMHQAIRKSIADKYGDDVAKNTSIIYGGSCNENNAESLFSCADVDGGLIGGASLKAASFLQIYKAL